MRRFANWLFFLLAILCSISIHAAPFERPAVMAPLLISDWGAFKQQLRQAKDIGVVAVTTDVWWGKVEGHADQEFDWQYYDSVSQEIINAGLKWVPTLSFHQCGGNVGDDCDIPIPPWIWQALGGDVEYLQYKSEQGRFSSEVISLWADQSARIQYEQFIQAFVEHYKGKAAHIEEINISAGPSGELRYPSYNQHDGFSYPQRGYLQSYSRAAKDDFKGYIQQRYNTLDGVNKAWGTTISSWEQILPPSDADGFFGRQDYLNIQYGRDFIRWYNQELLDHGRLMIDLAIDVLGDEFPGIPLAIKIPGIHWQISSPYIPRSAEISAGLIPSDIDLNSDETAHGYAPMIDMIKGANRDNREVLLHFTCLEMDNTPNSPDYSLAKDLVFWLGNGAGARGLTIMGENALSGGIESDHGWDNIENAIRWSSYRGLTTLRLSNLAENNGLGFQRYQGLISILRQ